MKSFIIILIIVFLLLGSTIIVQADNSIKPLGLPDKVVMTFDYKAAINDRMAGGFTNEDPWIQRWKELRIQKIKMLTPEQAQKYGILDEYEILKSGIPAISEQAALDMLQQGIILYIDNTQLNSDIYKINGMYYVQLRKIAELLDLDLFYEDGRIDIISKDNTEFYKTHPGLGDEILKNRGKIWEYLTK